MLRPTPLRVGRVANREDSTGEKKKKEKENLQCFIPHADGETKGEKRMQEGVSRRE